MTFRHLLYLSLAILYILHNDLWLWHDASLMLGLPVGLLYHIGFCVVATGLMILLVNYAWPSDLEPEEDSKV